MNICSDGLDLDFKVNSKVYNFKSNESNEVYFKIKDLNLFKLACFYVVKYKGDFYILKNRKDMSDIDFFKSYTENLVLHENNSKIINSEELYELINSLYLDNKNLYVFLEM